MTDIDGCHNPTADRVARRDGTWSDTNLDREFTGEGEPFDRLKCGGCGGVSFEVLKTGEWETTARCNGCGMYYIVHTG